MKSKIICFLRKALKIEKFEEFARNTSDFRYLTAEYVAKLEGISIQHAKERLDTAVDEGFLEKRYLFTEIDLALNILVEKDQIGKKVTIDDLPESIASKEIFISPQFTKGIYVAS